MDPDTSCMMADFMDQVMDCVLRSRRWVSKSVAKFNSESNLGLRLVGIISFLDFTSAISEAC